MDLYVDDKSNTINATFELPGLKKEDVNIEVTNGVLTISGESKQETDRDENGYAVKERRYGKFTRALQLPQGIKVRTSVSLCYLSCPETDQHSLQEADIKASLENGVLNVSFPKTSAEQAPKRITVS